MGKDVDLSVQIISLSAFLARYPAQGCCNGVATVVGCCLEHVANRLVYVPLSYLHYVAHTIVLLK